MMRSRRLRTVLALATVGAVAVASNAMYLADGAGYYRAPSKWCSYCMIP